MQLLLKLYCRCVEHIHISSLVDHCLMLKLEAILKPRLFVGINGELVVDRRLGWAGSLIRCQAGKDRKKVPY